MLLRNTTTTMPPSSKKHRSFYIAHSLYKIKMRIFPLTLFILHDLAILHVHSTWSTWFSKYDTRSCQHCFAEFHGNSSRIVPIMNFIYWSSKKSMARCTTSPSGCEKLPFYTGRDPFSELLLHMCCCWDKLFAWSCTLKIYPHKLRTKITLNWTFSFDHL